MNKNATSRPFRLILFRAKLAATEVLCDVLNSRHVTQAKVSSRSTCVAAKLHVILQEKLRNVTQGTLHISTFGGKARV